MTKKDLSSDEEFLADSASEPSAKEAAFLDLDSEGDADLSEEEEEERKPEAVKNIDDEELGTAEESRDDDRDGVKGNNKKLLLLLLPQLPTNRKFCHPKTLTYCKHPPLTMMKHI
jgi:hypothetical protein